MLYQMCKGVSSPCHLSLHLSHACHNWRVKRCKPKMPKIDMKFACIICNSWTSFEVERSKIIRLTYHCPYVCVLPWHEITNHKNSAVPSILFSGLVQLTCSTTVTLGCGYQLLSPSVSCRMWLLSGRWFDICNCSSCLISAILRLGPRLDLLC